MERYFIYKRQQLGKWFVKHTAYGITQEELIGLICSAYNNAKETIDKIESSKSIKEAKQHIVNYYNEGV